ncbi:flavin reductase family protein [Curtanaerobium respiraculi]|uniref:flavin reductase family protein n=1 Tax=Curtanaerobium respiraculi TaxID=2949669 RepID=UPI0024B3B5A5|nr:flavin reductase [Curtanaerobium respiraculi]
MLPLDIEPFEYADRIAQANPRGILFTTKVGVEVDTMVIGWGQIGTLWGRPVFTAFIRTSRESYRLMELHPEFTINVPMDGRLSKDVFSVAGSTSGRDHNKIVELGLTLVNGRVVDVPAIKEVPLTLECRVLYRHEMVKENFPEWALQRFYPENVTDIDVGASCYTHVMYVGEIVDSYILKG